MKLSNNAKTIRVRTLDGKMETRTIHNCNGTKVAAGDTHKAITAFKGYLNNTKQK